MKDGLWAATLPVTPQESRLSESLHNDRQNLCFKIFTCLAEQPAFSDSTDFPTHNHPCSQPLHRSQHPICRSH